MNERLPENYILKETYDFLCSECSKELHFKPSLLMQMGINCGHCTCPKCGEFLKLFVDTENNLGGSTPYSRYLNER